MIAGSVILWRRVDRPGQWRAGGRFVRELPVDEAGFVTVYRDFWESEKLRS